MDEITTEILQYIGSLLYLNERHLEITLNYPMHRGCYEIITVAKHGVKRGGDISATCQHYTEGVQHVASSEASGSSP